MKKNKYFILFCCFFCLLAAGCKKDFLDTRPAKSLLVPQTPADMRALLDNTFVFNLGTGLTSLADGDLYATDAALAAYPYQRERNSYTWAQDIWGSETAGEWNVPYQQVFYANVVLDGLRKLPASPETRELTGTALFLRAFAFYQLAQEFAPAYDAGSAAGALGIPLPLEADVTERKGRVTLQQTYVQILGDLKQARALLPATVTYKSRPTIAAAFAMLARTYLVMGDHASAGRYADSCITLRPALIDYNNINVNGLRPFPRALPNGNDEVLFYAIALDYTFGDSSSPTYIAPELYNSYEATDLRRSAFFRPAAPGFYKFKGNYAGILSYFCGLAMDEQYLIRAECRARQGDVPGAMADLNILLVKRYRTGTFTTRTVADQKDALAIILSERRKELVLRNIRWSDLRRLNKEAATAVTLTRTVNGQPITLLPNSPRYTYPIPPDELRLNPMPQNER